MDSVLCKQLERMTYLDTVFSAIAAGLMAISPIQSSERFNYPTYVRCCSSVALVCGLAGIIIAQGTLMACCGHVKTARDAVLILTVLTIIALSFTIILLV
ncbi:hypothetical protein FRC02_006249 [Tulasnella sp. 418]|nr:hypothetical protein FRC02_006249 [Tulasnella sp. 418]